jgi:hypothetical protein
VHGGPPGSYKFEYRVEHPDISASLAPSQEVEVDTHSNVFEVPRPPAFTWHTRHPALHRSHKLDQNATGLWPKAPHFRLAAATGGHGARPAAHGLQRAAVMEQQIGGSGGSLEPPGPLLEPPGPLLTHLHTVYMGYSERLPTRLNPLAERTCFSQVPLGETDQPAVVVRDVNGQPLLGKRVVAFCWREPPPRRSEPSARCRTRRIEILVRYFPRDNGCV